MADKMRVHLLAKELNVSSKAIIDKCLAEGIDSVKNHMSTLSAGLHATIKEWFSEGRHSTALETAQRIDLKKIRIKSKKKSAGREVATVENETDMEGVATGTATLDAPPVPSVAAEAALDTPQADETVEDQVVEKPGGRAVSSPSAAIAEPPPAVEVVAERPVALTLVAETDVPPATTVQASSTGAPAVTPPAPEPGAGSVKTIVPAGPQNVPAAAKLQGPRVVRYEALDFEVRPPRRGPE